MGTAVDRSCLFPSVHAGFSLYVRWPWGSAGRRKRSAKSKRLEIGYHARLTVVRQTRQSLHTLCRVCTISIVIKLHRHMCSALYSRTHFYRQILGVRRPIPVVKVSDSSCASVRTLVYLVSLCGIASARVSDITSVGFWRCMW